MYLTFSRPDIGMIDAYALPIGRRTEPNRSLPTASPINETLTVTHQGDTVTIEGQDFACTLDRSSGQIIRAQRHGIPSLVGGPELLILPLNSKGGTQMTKQAQDFAPFTDVCAARTVGSVTVKKQDNRVLLEVRDSYTQASGGYTLEINAQGQLTLEYAYEILQPVNPRQWGMVLSVAKAFDTLNWQRR